MSEHRVRTYDDPDDDERAYWECDCGRGGSTSAWNVDLHSDKHIREDPAGTRIDVSGGSG